jgi:hypothetical protein
VTNWRGKPCQRCALAKGPKYIDRKYCYRCTQAEKKDASNRDHRKRVATVYGMQAESYDLLYAAQNGVCAICLRATGRTRRLAVDHNHATGEVRGLLCRPCNSVLAHARDEVAFFARALEYLVCPPARGVLKNDKAGVS